MNMQSPTFSQRAWDTLIQVWVVFSLVLATAVTIWSVVSHENPLLSDNPYIIGFLFAVIAASLALIHSVTEHFRQLARQKHWIVAVLLVSWCLALTVWDSLNEGEGHGWGYFIAIGSLVAGGLSWLVCTFRFPMWISATVSAIGFVLLFAYGYVVAWMNTVS